MIPSIFDWFLQPLKLRREVRAHSCIECHRTIHPGTEYWLGEWKSMLFTTPRQRVVRLCITCGYYWDILEKIFPDRELQYGHLSEEVEKAVESGKLSLFHPLVEEWCPYLLHNYRPSLHDGQQHFIFF